MVVQAHQQQVQRMTTTPTRWRVTKVNRNNNNNKKEQTKILSFFVLFSDIMSYLTFFSFTFDCLLL